MALRDTLQVRWPEKFGQRIVTIAVEDFDAAKHRRLGDPEPAPPAAPVERQPATDGPADIERPAPRRKRGE